jgi:hypothetical protein
MLWTESEKNAVALHRCRQRSSGKSPVRVDALRTKKALLTSGVPTKPVLPGAKEGKSVVAAAGGWCRSLLPPM